MHEDETAAGPTRRAFVGTAVRAGLAASAVGPWLIGCTRKGVTPRPDGLEEELSLYNWSDYIAPDTIANFERETGVRVTYDTYESNEEMAGKLLAGATGYDLVVPSGYILPVLRAQGLLAPLDRARIPNLANVAPPFRDFPGDPGNVHSVPWQWGVTGIAYRTDKVTAPTSWEVFLSGGAPGRMTMLDDGREVLAAFLKYRGHSLNSTDPAALGAAAADARAAKPRLAAFVSAPVKGQLVAGDVWMAQLWDGDARQAAREHPAIAFAVPEDGSLIWADAMALLANAPHPRAAHAFLDYVLRAEVGAAISDATGYGTPNAAAAPLVRAPVPYPTAAELARLEYQRDLGEATALWDRLWTEIKAA